MANAEGSSSVNPLHIEHVDDPEMTWASTQLHRPPTSKTTANIELSAQENSARGTTLTQTQGESVLEPQLPRHQQDVGRSKVNDVQVDTSVEEKPSCLPIGDVADSERERTTSCGATKNIIFHSGIVNEVPDSATQTPHPKKVEVSDALSPLKKPRIVKRAMSPPQWKTFNVQQSHRSEKGHARPLDHDQALGMSLRSVEAPGERNVDREARNNPIPNSGHHVEVQRNVVNELLPIRALPKDNHPTMNSSVLTSMGPPRTVPTPTPLPVLGSFSAPGIAPQTSQLPTPIIHVALSNHKFDNRDNSHIRIDSELAEHSDDLVAPINIETTRQRIHISLKRHLNDRYKDHAYITKNTMWRQRTCYERDARARAKGRPVQATQVLPEKYEQATSPFQSMSAIQIPFDKSKIKEQFRDFTQETFSRSGLKKNLTKSAWSVSTTKYKSGALQMPSFREHVGLKTNILADNDSRLLTLPWFGDIENDKEEDDLVAKLQQIYELVHGVNGLKDLRNEQCRFYTGSIDKFLKDIGITWDTILYWLLAPEAELERVYKSSCSRKDVESLLVDRSAINTEAIRCSKEDTGLLLERSEDYRQKLLSRLERPSTLQLMQTALACAAILKKCSFSPWYMARQSKTMRDYVQGKTRKAEIASDFKFRRIICRVCHTHNCLFHGQVRERPDSEPDSECEDSTDKDSEANDDSEHMLVLETIIPAHVDSDDSDVEKVINYRLPMNAEVTVNNNILGHKALESKPFDQKDYLEAIKWENRKPFIPCSHAGDCAEAKCRCFREGVTCEKTCRCPSSCNRRFPGCNCASGPSKRPCAANRGCLCAKFHRECDADLCVACGATEILDPANRYNDDLLQDQCRNVGIQRGVPKKTLLGQSEVHGFGLYAGQDIKRDDIVGEYTGEILSTKESERREHIYGYEKNMYLFKLNMEQDVDATRMGNKLRFINNANPDRSNCYPKVLFCNTVFRIALFANSDIKAGTELFFHYNYPAEMTKHFKQPKGRVVAVKQPVTQPSRPKQKRVSSPSPSRVAERPYQANILERARAAKAAKRAAMLAERDLQTTLNSNSNGPLRAQKSVPILQSQRQASSNSRLQGRPGVVQDLDIEESFTSESAIQDEIAFNTAEDSTTELLGMSTPSPVIQDTDEEDELFPEGLRGDVIPSDDRAVNRAVDTTDRVASTTEEDTRTMIIKSEAPLFVAEEIRETQGEMRHEEFRKRKRPVITNSDDDE